MTLESALRKLGEKVPCSIEVLTPVHVGEGVRLQKGSDFVVSDKGTTVVPPALLFRYLTANPAAHTEPFAQVLSRVDGRRRYPVRAGDEVLAFTRDGNERPYLPGSSLKGALRTVLLQRLVKPADIAAAKDGNSKKEFADDALDRSVFMAPQASPGKAPNHDLLRALAVGDALFGEGALDLKRIHVLNLTSADGQRAGWWSRGRTGRDPRDSTSIFAEMLDVGARANGSLRVDAFLFSPEAQRELRLPSRFDLGDLAAFANRYARRRLDREIDFIDAIDTELGLDPLLDSLEALLGQVPAEGSAEERDHFVLRVGWGSGWRSMTGDYLEPKEEDVFRQRYRLGRPGMPFPKTRKVVFDGGEPAHLCGWLLVRLGDRVESAGPTAAAPASPEPARAVSAPPAPATPAPAPPPGAVRAEVLDPTSKPARVRILEGEYAGAETILPGVNAPGLGLQRGDPVYVRLHARQGKLQKADWVSAL